ncbi:glycosyl transferase, partial [Bacillus inaquosorum]|nr:glycosyl transferase [Bacillus inaquosorum]
IYDSMYPIGCIIGQILKVPTVASHAVFAKPEELIPKNKNMVGMGIVNDHPALNEYRAMVQRMNETFNIDTPNL